MSPLSNVYDAVKKATVAVVKSVPGKSPLPYSIVGSGFCVHPEGIVVTCEHVVKGFLTQESLHRVRQANTAATGEKVPIQGAVPHVVFYLGVEKEERCVKNYLVPVSHAVADVKYGFDLAILRIPPADAKAFPAGYPTLSIADYADLHEMMEIATCGFPLGDLLHDQLGTLTSSFTKGVISSVIPAFGVAREHVKGFQLDLTTTNGNSGGPVFSLLTGQVFGVLQGGVRHPQGYVIQGLKTAQPIYPLLDTDMLARLPSADPPG